MLLEGMRRKNYFLSNLFCSFTLSISGIMCNVFDTLRFEYNSIKGK